MKRLSAGAEEVFKSQMGEAWLHYRHCEAMRTQYLTFFFTAYVGVIGFGVNLLKTEPSAATLFGISILIDVLFCFSAAVFVAVVRLGLVTEFYFHAEERTRRYFFAEEPYALQTWTYAPLGAHPKTPSLFSIQKSATAVIAFLCLCLAAAQLLLGIALLRNSHRNTWRPNIAFVSCAAMAIALAGY